MNEDIDKIEVKGSFHSQFDKINKIKSSYLAFTNDVP